MTAESLKAVLGQPCPHGADSPVDGRFSRYSCLAPSLEGVSWVGPDIQGQLLGVLAFGWDSGLQGTLRVMSTASSAGDRLRQTENRATRCKVERLQLLLQQKRLRRKARRDARGPYHWPPSRKAGRSDSTGSGGGGGPSEAAGLGLDFEDSVWKPEVNPDIKSEFVVA